MRTPRKISRLGPPVLGRRAARAWLLAGLVLGVAFGLSSCDAGGGDGSATRPTTDRSGTRPAPSVTESPSVTVTEPTRSTRTSATTPTSTRTPTSAEALPTSSPAPSAAGTPAAAEDGGMGALGWALLIVLVVGAIAGWLIWRSRRRSAWDAQADALEADTRTATRTQLPSVLTAEAAGQRALSWPPRRGRRERSAGNRPGLAAPAATGGRGRTGVVRGADWRAATGAARRPGALVRSWIPDGGSIRPAGRMVPTVGHR
jgi:hypothetical protein